MAKLLIITLAALILISSSCAYALQYQIHVLDLPAGLNYSGASGINDAGEIAGYFSANYSGCQTPIASLWNSDGFHQLGFNLFSYSNAQNNNAGVVAGGMNYWINGQVFSLPGRAGTISDINDDGLIVGYSLTDMKLENACYWNNNEFHYLSSQPGWEVSYAFGLNDHNQIVGTLKHEGFGLPDYQAVIWNNGTMTELKNLLPGYSDSDAYDINNLGQVVGILYNYDNTPGLPLRKAFLWQNGVMIDFLGLNSTHTIAKKITDSGYILGYTFEDIFVWKDGVTSWLPKLSVGGYTTVMDINENGWVVGQAKGSDGNYHAVLWTPVPEPSSVITLFIGLGTLASVVRRKYSR